MQKTCAQCSASFEVTDDEKKLHTHLNKLFETGPIPEPKICSDCRMREKMIWRNERILYNRKCDKTDKDILSIYPADVPFPVYERHAWWSDSWDALDYGQEFDFNKPFFDQFEELQKSTPRAALNTQNVENCDYCNFAFDCRNCYLCHCSYDCESLLYCYWSLRCKDCTDCSYCFESEKCLWCTDCNHAFGCVSCQLSHTCIECLHCYDCRNCQNCFGCCGLRNQSYHMFNEKLTKEEYEERLAQFDLQNPSHVSAVEKRLAQLRENYPHKHSIQEQNENCSGDYVFESRNCLNCFQVYRSEDCINVQDSETKSALDCYHIGWSEGTYGSYSDVRQHSAAFNVQCWNGSDNFYSDNCQSCSHCFGCISLKQKEYCILNRKYSEQEYKDLLPKIVDHMKSTDEWGQFFPMSISPFSYNETMAQEEYPLSKEEALKHGWRWKDDLPYTKGKETKQWNDIPTNIEDVPGSITNDILVCEATGRNFRITKQELDFYKERSLPLPRLHPDERHRKRMALRNPRKLWKRKCDKCSKDIQTTYSPDRKETVYCEQCYLAEVY